MDSAMLNPEMVNRDYLRALRHAFPVAFERCCACSRADATNATLPCHTLLPLWGECFAAHTTPTQLAAFLVEELGIFGIFGNEMDHVPDAVLRADHRLSWVVNNAYKWKRAAVHTAVHEHGTSARGGGGGGRGGAGEHTHGHGGGGHGVGGRASAKVS